MYKKNQGASKFKVAQEDTLLNYVMQSLSGVSRTKAKAILSGGGVKVNGVLQQYFAFPLKKGDVVEISKRKDNSTLKSKWVKIVFEDKDILVVEKVEGILSMSSQNRLFSVKTILDDYLKKTRQKCTAHVVHRLDRDTSGLLVYAKNVKVQQIFVENWKNIVYDRRYIAVVSGKLSGKGVVKNWLKDNAAYITYSSNTDNGGKYSVTHYEVKKSNETCSLVELKLETGRKNQIRVHMQDLGHPVCGDIKYGDGFNPIDRLGLHAYKLSFFHPITNEKMSFETPMPRNFMRLF